MPTEMEKDEAESCTGFTPRSCRVASLVRWYNPRARPNVAWSYGMKKRCWKMHFNVSCYINKPEIKKRKKLKSALLGLLSRARSLTAEPWVQISSESPRSSGFLRRPVGIRLVISHSYIRHGGKLVSFNFASAGLFHPSPNTGELYSCRRSAEFMWDMKEGRLVWSSTDVISKNFTLIILYYIILCDITWYYVIL